MAKPAALELALVAGQTLFLTTDLSVTPSTQALPVSYEGLPSVVKPGDSIFVGQYLFTGSETSSVYLRVISTDATTVTCEARNSATLGGLMLTVHLENCSTRIPILPEHDVAAIRGWGARNAIDFLSLSFTTCAADVEAARALLTECGLADTHIMAKVENREGLVALADIADVADGIILSRGNLGVDLPPEKLFKTQKLAVATCADRGKPCVITRVLDSMVDAPRPTRAEATDVANAVLDGCDGFLLGAETLRGAFPVETVRVVLSIAHEAECVFNSSRYYKRCVPRIGCRGTRALCSPILLPASTSAPAGRSRSSPTSSRSPPPPCAPLTRWRRACWWSSRRRGARRAWWPSTARRCPSCAWWCPS